MTTITGRSVNLKDFHGKVVLVTFWATDCPSCIEEIPRLIELYQHYHPGGFDIIAIAMPYDPPSHVVELTKNKQIPYDVVLDLKAELAQAFGGIMAIPTSFLIAPDGMIIKKTVGLFETMEMASAIEQLLANLH